MKANKATVLTLAEKYKNILAANWQGHLNTIKADAKGSKQDIYTSKVKYILRRGRPYIWVPENELHNVSTIVDERGSFAVTSPLPGPLANLLRSIKKAQLAAESLKYAILSKNRVISESNYTVSGVLSSSNFITTSRSENLKELVDEGENYVIYRFNSSSCMYVDGHGCTQEVELKDIETTKADPLAPLSAKLIDGINQTEARRKALMLFCFIYANANARDAFLPSVDRKGIDALGKVPNPVIKDGTGEFLWKEFRFTIKEEAREAKSFCRQLVEMEEEVVNKVSSYSGLV